MDNNELMVIDQNGETMLNPTISQTLLLIADQKAVIEAREKAIREWIMNAMKENGIKSIGNDYLVVTYKDENYRETFDSKAFKKDHEELYNDYVRLSKTAESVMIRKR